MNVNCNDLNSYADFVESLWLHNRDEMADLAHVGFGLAGETGEVLELLKKYIRDGVLDPEKLKKELGDQIYYWTKLCRKFGFLPSEVVLANVDKLTSRKERGVLQGSGDNR